VAFSAALALVLGVLTYTTTAAVPDINLDYEQDLLLPRLSAGLVFALLTIPFFQAWQEEDRPTARLWQLPYPRLHEHAWTDVVLYGGAWVFCGLVALLLALWALLFQLIGIETFATLFTKDWFVWPVAVATWAVGVALLRDWPRVVRPLKRLVQGVLAVLAPVLAAIALLWLAALPVTGLEPLWATRNATPILLSVMILGLLLANAVINDEPADEPSSVVLRWSGRVLGAALLPLAAIAAISTGLRIAQHGLTPERCYAVLFVVVALLYALAYSGLLALRWRAWTAAVRPANIVLALITMALAFVVSTPFADMERLSAANQEARLMDGRVKAEDFDFGALRFRMGEPGLDALTRIRAAKDHPQAAVIAQQLAMLDKSDSWWDWQNRFETPEERDTQAEAVTIFAQVVPAYPAGAVVPETLKRLLVSEQGMIARQCFPNFQDARAVAATVREDRTVCALVQLDVQPGGAPEWVLLTAPCATCDVQASLWLPTPTGGWARVVAGGFQSRLKGGGLRAALAAGQFSAQVPAFREVVVGEAPFVLDPRLAEPLEAPADVATPR
jgi:hypothetical protein